jgi:hypothetical protein
MATAAALRAKAQRAKATSSSRVDQNWRQVVVGKNGFILGPK